jgi:DNA-directed RNA polymerase specialized sigma24 family protein
VDFTDSWQAVEPLLFKAITRYWGHACNVDDLIQDVALLAYLHREQFHTDRATNP